MFTKKPVPNRDQVVIFADDGTADIATIIETDDQAIYAASGAQEYAIPMGDIKKVFVGPTGRIYTLFADCDYVKDTERLAALEKSIVLHQVTHFQKPAAAPEGSGINIRTILMYAMIGILLLAVIFK